MLTSHTELDDEAGSFADIGHQLFTAITVGLQFGIGFWFPRQDTTQENVFIPMFLIKGIDFWSQLGQFPQFFHAAAEDNAWFVALAFFGIELALQTSLISCHDDVANLGWADNNAAFLFNSSKTFL